MIAILLVDGAQRQLGYVMLAISLVPIADGAIVLRSRGPLRVACGVHWATAAVMLVVAALLLV